jgi:hypothetical protein
MVDLAEAGQAVYQPLEKTGYAGATIFIGICIVAVLIIIFWMFGSRRG